MLSEQIRHVDLFGHGVRADALEDVVLRYIAAGRQRATLRGDGLDLGAQRNLGLKELIPCLTIDGTFVGVRQMGHVVDLRNRGALSKRTVPQSVFGRIIVTLLAAFC